MALCQKLRKPFVVDPTADHTHTVVFLHRFPESTSDEELPTKVISTKRTRNHKTLQEQFPTIRWVFPFAKAGARPYGNLTAEDKAAVGLETSPSPYLTQILLQEARRLRYSEITLGLDRVILGGQGETAVAGHDAMMSFPEVPTAIRDNPDKIARFLHTTYHVARWTDPRIHPRLGGFVGMHADSREVTRDIASYSAASKTTETAPPRINTSIVTNTPHLFIHGGYKVQTTTWDGRRIDDFAKFLAVDVGIYRVSDPQALPTNPYALTPKDRDQKKKPRDEAQELLNDAQKYALEVAKEKKANEALAEKVKIRIEADKVERKIRQERERQARLRREQTSSRGAGNSAGPIQEQPRTLYGRMGNPGLSPNGYGFDGTYDSHSDGGELEEKFVKGEYSEDEDDGDEEPSPDAGRYKKRRVAHGRRAAGDGEWAAPSGTRGQMSEGQLRAFGLIKSEGEEVKE